MGYGQAWILTANFGLGLGSTSRPMQGTTALVQTHHFSLQVQPHMVSMSSNCVIK